VQLEEDLTVVLELAEYDQEIAINQELQQEWNSYSYIDVSSPCKEQPWGELNPQISLFNQIETNLLSVPATLARTEYGTKKCSSKVIEYAKGFPNNLHMTQNFYRTCSEDLPLLHPSIKEAFFILVLEGNDKEIHFVILSENDAGFFKQWLTAHDEVDAF